MTVSSTSNDLAELDQCANCGLTLKGLYCHGCGQKKDQPEDWRTPVFLRNLVSEFISMDSRLWQTIKMLITKPGSLTQAFLSGRRGQFFTPTRVFLICSALFVLMGNSAIFQADKMVALQPNSRLADLFQRVANFHEIPLEQFTTQFTTSLQKRVKFLLPITVFLLAATLRLFFSKSKPNWTYAHHLVFSMHFISFSFLISTLFFLLVGWINYPFLLDLLNALINIGYLYMAMKLVFGGNRENLGRAVGTFGSFYLFKFFIIFIAITTSLIMP